MIRAVAIDDEPPALRIIEYYCKANELVDSVKVFTNPDDALEYLNKDSVDLIFVDIQIQDCNGLEFYNSLKIKPMVVFTTAYSEYAVEGFNLDAVDYLLKPYSQERFNQAIKKVSQLTKLQVKEKRILNLRANYSVKSIEIDNILLIESFDDYVTFHFLSGEKLEIRLTLKKLLEMLPPKEFIRVHRSFIVSINYISEIRNKVIHIGNRKIPISTNYEKDFFELFNSN